MYPLPTNCNRGLGPKMSLRFISVCVPLLAKPPLRPGLASSPLLNRRPLRGDDAERQDVDSKHGRHGSGALDGEATRLLMSREVMFAVPGGVCVSVGVSVRV